MAGRFSGAMEGPARFWCKLMHPDPMWPIRGYYRCRRCLRQYPVPWETRPETTTEIRVVALHPELLAMRANAGS